MCEYNRHIEKIKAAEIEAREQKMGICPDSMKEDREDAGYRLGFILAIARELATCMTKYIRDRSPACRSRTFVETWRNSNGIRRRERPVEKERIDRRSDPQQ
jgi:hypothetical protein